MPSRAFRFSKMPIVKKTFDKNPKRTIASKSDPPAPLFLHAVTTRRGFIRLSEIYLIYW